jgi:hypothetical protein
MAGSRWSSRSSPAGDPCRRQRRRTVTGAHLQGRTDPLLDRRDERSKTGGEFAIVAPHVTKFRNGAVGSDVQDPLPTVTANSHKGKPGAGQHRHGRPRAAGAGLHHRRQGLHPAADRGAAGAGRGPDRPPRQGAGVPVVALRRADRGGVGRPDRHPAGAAEVRPGHPGRPGLDDRRHRPAHADAGRAGRGHGPARRLTT